MPDFLYKTSRGKQILMPDSLHNFLLFCELDPALIRLWGKNAWSGKIELIRVPPWREFISKHQLWEEVDTVSLKSYIASRKAYEVRTTIVKEALAVLGQKYRFRWFPGKKTAFYIDRTGESIKSALPIQKTINNA